MLKQTGAKRRVNSSQEQTHVRKRMWSTRVLGKYWALQLPGTALLILILYLLRDRLEIPTWLLWSIVAGWVVKDILLYPLLWRSYDPGYPMTAHAMEGAHGVVVERLDPSGYVRVRGELWRAELADGSRPVKEGERIRVEAMKGLTLLVQREDEENI